MEENKEMLSQKEVMEVVQMAQQIYNTQGFGYFTPYMSNQNQIDLNNNPLIPTADKMDRALTNYTTMGDELKAYTEFAYTTDMLLNRTARYYANLLAFDLRISCSNAYNPKVDYKSKEYIDDLNRVYKFLDRFKVVEEFSKVVLELLKSETYFTWLRDSEGTYSDTGDIEVNESVKSKKSQKYTLQILPQDRCLLTNRWENGFLFTFDMSYFLRAGVSINSFDPVFKKYWNNTFENNKNKFIPTTPLNKRDGTFSTITQTSPLDGAWCFKFSSQDANTNPFLAPMIKPFISNEEMRLLQIDKNMLSAYAVIIGSIPLLDKQKSGQTQDAMAYSTKMLMKFMALSSAGMNKNIKNVATPTENPRMVQYQDFNDNMYKNNIKSTVGQTVSASRLMFSDDKMSESEMKNAIVTDFNTVKHLYEQFDNFLKYYVNKKTRKYNFNFNFHGCTYPALREEDKKNLLEIADKGFVLNTSAYSSIVDMQPQDFDRSLSEGHYSDLSERLTLLMSIHTMSGKDGVGSPKKTDSDISDSGSTSRDYE